MMTRWYHGTSQEAAEKILTSGAFHIGTWFARTADQAKRFGGPYLFEVEMECDQTPLGWQVHLANALPLSAVRDHGLRRR